ncbi:hypothetical protein JK358_32175 [Nocardia sp. 2]|uniref:Secreted protein n=1 Tax=Nocardia acididurans TaxID=2802282 RepID=A0ABS1MFN5_9NOCA|nr:hypothetical protein [Nocardia acididurans]MBL1079071.1 hypothetical protein [Nocardia acididurans]
MSTTSRRRSAIAGLTSLACAATILLTAAPATADLPHTPAAAISGSSEVTWTFLLPFLTIFCGLDSVSGGTTCLSTPA